MSPVGLVLLLVVLCYKANANSKLKVLKYTTGSIQLLFLFNSSHIGIKFGENRFYDERNN